MEFTAGTLRDALRSEQLPVARFYFDMVIGQHAVDVAAVIDSGDHRRSIKIGYSLGVFFFGATDGTRRGAFTGNEAKTIRFCRIMSPKRLATLFQSKALPIKWIGSSKSMSLKKVRPLSGLTPVEFGN